MKKTQSKVGTRIFLFVTLLSMVAFDSTGRIDEWKEKVDQSVVDAAENNESAEFLVYLSEQVDLSGAAALETKEEKGAYVFNELTEVASLTQKPLLDALEKWDVDYRPFWVANMILVSGDLTTLVEIAGRPDVAYVHANPRVRLDPAGAGPSLRPIAATMAAESGIEWNISRVNAPDVWSMTFRGQGVVVGGQDTGYEWDHPALINQYRGWENGQVQHDYNWHDAIHSGGGVCGSDSTEPCDDHNHGTHTMGIMVGDDGGSNQIGVAPGASWIGCRNMDQGVGTPASYSECYQWFIAPTDLDGANPDPSKAPDVINNSWSCPPSEGCDSVEIFELLEAVVDNVRAAGILTVHSAGNSGLSCSSIDAPAAIYESSFTVGATNASDLVTTYSSRGPVTIDNSMRLKPDVSAPGGDASGGIRSSIRGGGYATFIGTSMAAPHVAGLAALLLSANPTMTGQVDEIEQMITTTAIPKTTSQTCGSISEDQVPNNTYGYGLIDARAAVANSLPYRLYFPMQGWE